MPIFDNSIVPGISDFLTQVSIHNKKRYVKTRKNEVRDLREGYTTKEAFSVPDHHT